MSRAIVFLADGFEECEGLIVVDLLRRANVKVMMASTMGRLEVRSSRNILIRADTLDSQVDYDSADLIVLPGGREGTRNLLSSDIVKEQCKRFAAIKTIAAIQIIGTPHISTADIFRSSLLSNNVAIAVISNVSNI